MERTPITSQVIISDFGGIDKATNPTHLGPGQEGVALAQEIQNAARDFRTGALASRRGLIRVTFTESFTIDARIDGFGALTIYNKTIVLYNTSNGTLRRLTSPTRTSVEANT